MKKLSLITLALLFLLSSKGQNDNARAIENMVFAGAGIRGIAYVGALEKLDSLEVLSNIKRYAGSSAGSIVAMCLSVGYEPQEMKEVLSSVNFSQFTKSKAWVFGGINRTFKEYGFYEGEEISKWYGSLLKAKTGNANITFRQLVDSGFKPLYITGTSLSQQRMIVFSHETYPDMRVRDAVRISSSIPLYFEPVNIDEQGRIIMQDTSNTIFNYKIVKSDTGRLPEIRKKEKSTNSKIVNLVVDGGFASNLPMEIFDDASLCADCELPNKEGYLNPHSLGFTVVRPEQYEMDKESHELAPFEINEFADYLEALYTFTMEYKYRKNMPVENWERIIVISDGNLTWQVETIPQEKINLLLENGRQAASKYLEKHPIIKKP